MLLTVPLLIVVSLKLMHMLTERGAWLGFIGCVMAVFGAVMGAVDIDLFGLIASAILAIALVPYGLQPIRSPPGRGATPPS